MATELVSVKVQSIYKRNGVLVCLPSKMAQATPDFAAAIKSIESDVLGAGAPFRLSDMYRTYEMQYKAHMDYKEGRKSAYSPPPGGSFHESGRAIDIDVAALKPLGDNHLGRFWDIAAKYSVIPIISTPNPKTSECWHFECRGEFQTVRELQGYKQAVRAAILDIGGDIKEIQDDAAAWIQGQILAYGIDIGPIDGLIGQKTKAAIREIKNRHEWPGARRVGVDSHEWESIDEWLTVFLDVLKVRAA